MRALQLACTLWTVLIVLALPSWGSQGIFTSLDVHSTQAFKKRIAIVGAGTAGVSTLKTLLVDLPDALGNDWDIVAFEQRDSVGGVWLPHAGPVPTPPELPETPLYPRLKTNTPHPTMTIPHFTFPPETALFPRHETVQRYHAHVLSHFNLTSHVKLSSRVVEARWTGQSWNLTVENRASSHGVHLPALQHAEFDHLIVANGHYHYPYEPVIEGLNEWRQREDKNVLHSIYFRRGEDFANKTVLVIGGGASGRDAARQITDYASSTIMSRKNTTYRGAPEEPELPSVIPKPHVTRFTRHGVWFDDGSFRSDVDTVLLATGYEHQVPFLTRGGHLKIVGRDAQNDVELSTNLRYIRPLFRHIFALDPSLPPTALAFVGLPIFVSNAITSTSQALVIGHAINNASILPSRGEMLVDLHTSEERFRSAGYEPGYVGHRLISLPDDQDLDAGAAYQDGLVRMLQNVGLGGYGIVPPASKNFTEEWRRFGRAHASLLKRGWERVERMGCDAVRTWIGGVKTEEQWADVVKELSSWEERNEEIILEDREDVEVSNLRK